MASQDKSPFVTPTFQAVLNNRITRIMDALDDGDYVQGYKRLRTLIYSLNPKHKEPLKTNDIAHINTLVANAMRQRSVDRYQTRRLQHHTVNMILRQHVLALYDKVMTLLHDKGYLEKHREPVEEGKE